MKNKTSIFSKMFLFALSLILISGFLNINTKIYARDVSEFLLLAKGLSSEQKAQVRNYYKDNNSIKTEYITLEDYKKYFDDDTSNEADLISSVYVKKTDNGGVKVKIKTPENITQIHDFQYESAAVTAGLENCEIEVIAVKKVTGEAALAGILKAGELTGSKITEKSGKTSVNELQKVNEVIKNNKDQNPAAIVKAINDTKKDIADEKAKKIADSININVIIDKLQVNLKENGVSLDKESINQLADIIKKFADNLDGSNIDKYKAQLSNLADDIKNSINNLTPEQKGLISKIIKAIADFFKAIFNWLLSLFS